MPELTWLGDAKARKAATHVPYRLLQPIEQVACAVVLDRLDAVRLRLADARLRTYSLAG